jgi:hypothetical protein
VQGARPLDVGDVGAAAAQQPLVLAALETLADVAQQRVTAGGSPRHTAPSRWSAAISSFE